MRAITFGNEIQIQESKLGLSVLFGEREGGWGDELKLRWDFKPDFFSSFIYNFVCKDLLKILIVLLKCRTTPAQNASISADTLHQTCSTTNRPDITSQRWPGQRALFYFFLFFFLPICPPCLISCSPLHPSILRLNVRWRGISFGRGRRDRCFSVDVSVCVGIYACADRKPWSHDTNWQSPLPFKSKQQSMKC